MINIHTKMFCQCGKRFTHVYPDNTAIPRVLTITEKCPFCGALNIAKYEFDANFKCLVPGELHYIRDHFRINNGNTYEEYYPRHCVCGEEVLLRQRRVI